MEELFGCKSYFDWFCIMVVEDRNGPICQKCKFRVTCENKKLVVSGEFHASHVFDRDVTNMGYI
jgi:hypothetical protein